MIKIIKKGNRKITECPQCGCVFSYETEDIIKDVGYEYVYKRISFYINCPQCKYKIPWGDNKINEI